MILALKFLEELGDNSSKRLKFDSWSMNSFIVYKESSSCLLTFIPGFFTENKFKSTDYKNVLRFHKVILKIL